MRTPASIRGHPIHPMLVPIAIGGFVLSLAADLIGLAGGARDPWFVLALYTMVGGIVVALYAFNAWLRSGGTQDLTLPATLSAVAALLLLVSGWLGGKMVFEAGVGVGRAP